MNEDEHAFYITESVIRGHRCPKAIYIRRILDSYCLQMKEGTFPLTMSLPIMHATCYDIYHNT